jgi:AraC-like DNA-binding protein
MRVATRNSVHVRFALPDAALQPFVTAYYCTDVVCTPRAPWLEDYIHPEWANLRFLDTTETRSVIGPGELQPTPSFAVTGPTSRAAHFRICSGRSWGIGLLPQGWAALFSAEACDYADRIIDGSADPLFARFRPLAKGLAACEGDYDAELALIESHMAQAFADAGRLDPAIAKLQAALVDPDMVTVSDLAAHLEMTVRSLERLSRRAFGFPPKLLIRRQRFLRCLARFMLDPSLTWLGTLDSRYYDQSHFVRDFRRFMGMNPSDYARCDKPIMTAVAKARMAAMGQAVQGLHEPTI